MLELEYGDTNVTIATSLAVEALFKHKISDQPSQEPPPPIYPFLYVNVRTLLRNLISAINTPSYTDQEVADALEQEMFNLANLVKGYSEDQMKVVYYYSEHVGLEKVLGYARFKKEFTTLQQQRRDFATAVFNYMFQKPCWKAVTVIPGLITGQHPKAYIITHYPIDLLAHRYFEKLELLETHTGRIRPMNEWVYKVVSNGKQAHHLPFNKMVISIWGDSNNLLMPYPVSTKKIIFDLAKECGWHSLTTKDKVIMDLDRLKDKPLADLLKSMMR